jgi:hypothetical protein
VKYKEINNQLITKWGHQQGCPTIPMLAAIAMRHALIFLAILSVSCNQKIQDKKNIAYTDTVYVVDTSLKGENLPVTAETAPVEKFEYQTVRFEIEKYYQKVTDTAHFIKALEENCHLYSNASNLKHLDKFTKTKLNGSTKNFYYIEYSYPISANAEFPGRYQIIFDGNGTFLKAIAAVRVDIVKILPAENPYLFALFSTAHGNGAHTIFRINKDTLEQVYDGFLGYRPQTYSTGYGNEVNIPNELYHKFIDENNDGFNDVIFFGKVRYSKIDLGTDDKIAPVKFVFLYNKANGHFVEKEDYSEKYTFIYGDTK